MKVSLKWLKDYVAVTAQPDEVFQKLTMAGLEVGEIQDIGGSWNNVIVGKIVGVEAHPNADRLKLVTVDLDGPQHTVVCGATNLTIGDKIAFAHVGAELIDGHSGKLAQLKPAKIRGVLSEGMVCSEKELGISDNHEGIMVLPQEAPVGVALSQYLGDLALDVKVTPNRPDCLSVIGIAREIAALTGSRFDIPQVQYQETEKPIDSFASVEIAAPDLCPRYCATLLTGIKVAPSPPWLQQRLLACGMRPINNIVDITNYVMLEYGQPLHAFDFRQIQGGQIIVRRARDGEVMTTLDETERALSSDTLVIADRDRAIALAGIMGGINSEVTDDTSVVLIESANFNQAVIHRTSIKLRLSSEASLRFEKGLSQELPLVALRRATQLMAQLAGGKVAQGIIDAYPGKQQKVPILLSESEVRRLLGMPLGMNQIIGALSALGFKCEHTRSPARIKVHIPWWRTDIYGTADIVEEIARIIGYDNIPTTMLSGTIPEQAPAPMIALRQKIRNALASCAFQEVLTYSLTSIEMLSKLSPEGQLPQPMPIRAANPMSREQEYLRTSLRPGVLSTLARNSRHSEGGIRLFEMGRIFLPRDRELPDEKERLCAVISDTQAGTSWQCQAKPADFFTAKGIAETLLSLLELEATFAPDENSSLSPGKTASISIGGEKVGVIGELHPGVARAFEIAGSAYLLEIDLDKLAFLAGSPKKYRPIPRYPSTARDIALLVDEHVTYKQVYDIMKDSPLVTEVTLFDLYSGEQTAGKKSLAFRIVYQSPGHTLTDDEVNKVQEQLLHRLFQKLGASLRA